MPRRVSRDVVWLAAISGLFALLCINVVVGVTKGFDRAGTNALVVMLASPGIAFGWGGVTLVLLAIPYALLTWRQGTGPGNVLAVLGALVFAFAIGGLAGVFAATPDAGGGRLAGGLASLLSGALGKPLAAIVMLLVAAPGLLLALAPLVLQSGVLQSGAARAAQRTPSPAAVKTRYPQARVGPDGEELPPEFKGSTDVGHIRFRDDAERAPAEPPVSTVTLSPPSAVDPAAKKPRPIVGVRFADEPLVDLSDASVAPPPPARVREEDRLPKGVRFADSPFEAAPPLTASADDFAGGGLADAHAAEHASPPPPVQPAPASGDDVPVASVEVAAGAPVVSPAAAAQAPVVVPVAEAGAPFVEPPAAADVEAPAPKSKRGESYRRKLSETGLLDRAPAPAPGGDAGTKSRTRQARPKDLTDAIRGLFSTLPLDDLPPIGPEAAVVGAETGARIDAPGQAALFDPSGSRGRHPASADPLFAPSVEAAIERGAGSLVLLKRKLGIGYARAAALMEALVEEGIVGEMTASGSRPTLVTAAEWERRSKTRAR